nr:transcription factor TFIIIB subunit brf1 [Polyrhizophydium stewartii]
MPSCSNCGPTEAETDDHLGHVVCVKCGGVLEENTIVSEVTFSETAKGSAIADGFQLTTGQARAQSRGTFGLIRTGGQESRQQTIQNGHRRIQEVASQPQIRMSERLVSQAQRYFNVAVANNFTKGRKAGNVVAACLYIVCRQAQTAHMLIDFADALSTNVYQVGATFLALCKVAGIVKMPLIDPSLYISRFVDKLDFGEEKQNIIKDANRLVQRMNRDWMQIGRRPSGICAASLFIAARMHGFSRTIREIIMVVKICEGTLRKRLKEFQETPSSQLSVTDFQTIWLEGEKDPPSYAPPKNRKLEQQYSDADPPELKSPTQTIAPSGSTAGVGPSQASTTSAREVSKMNSDGDDIAGSGGGDDNEGDDDEINEEALLEETKGILDREGKLGVLKELAQELASNEGDDDMERLSDLDDDDEIKAIIDVTPEEVEFKEAVWMEENRDWVLRQEAKRALEREGIAEKRKPRKKSSKRFDASTPAEATKNMIKSKPALSKKINYDVIDTLAPALLIHFVANAADHIAQFEKTEKIDAEEQFDVNY